MFKLGVSRDPLYISYMMRSRTSVSCNLRWTLHLCSSIFSWERRWRSWLEICAYRKKTTTTKPQKREKNSPQERLMTGGFLETSCSRVCAEYFKHPGKQRRGAYLCTRCGTENTVHVFKSVSQVDVSLTDTAALWGLLAFRWHRGRCGRWNQGKGPVLLSC